MRGFYVYYNGPICENIATTLIKYCRSNLCI